MDYDSGVHVSPMECCSAHNRMMARSQLPLSGTRTTLWRILLCKNNKRVSRSLVRFQGGTDRLGMVSIHESHLIHVVILTSYSFSDCRTPSMSAPEDRFTVLIRVVTSFLVPAFESSMRLSMRDVRIRLGRLDAKLDKCALSVFVWRFA